MHEHDWKKARAGSLISQIFQNKQSSLIGALLLCKRRVTSCKSLYYDSNNAGKNIRHNDCAALHQSYNNDMKAVISRNNQSKNNTPSTSFLNTET